MFKNRLAPEPAHAHLLNMFNSQARAGRRQAATVLARRAGRIAFGLALAAGMSLLAWFTLVDPRSSALARGLDARAGAHDVTAVIISGTWLAAAAGYLVVRLGVWLAAPAPRGDALLRASLVVPAIGLALAVPLGLHLAICTLAGGEFHEWASASVRAVGIAHLVFAATFALRAAGLARTSTPRISHQDIYLATVVASAIPLGMFVLPEILTALTGLAVLPVLSAFDWLAERERGALPLLPAARARLR